MSASEAWAREHVEDDHFYQHSEYRIHLGIRHSQCEGPTTDDWSYRPEQVCRHVDCCVPRLRTFPSADQLRTQRA